MFSPKTLLSIFCFLFSQGLSLWKRDLSTWGFEAVISSFIFQFPLRSSSASSLFPMPRGAPGELGGKKKVPQPELCSLGVIVFIQLPSSPHSKFPFIDANL